MKVHDPHLGIVTFKPILHCHRNDLCPVKRAQFLNLPLNRLKDNNRNFQPLRQSQDSIFTRQMPQSGDAGRIQRSWVTQGIRVGIVVAHWFILQAQRRRCQAVFTQFLDRAIDQRIVTQCLNLADRARHSGRVNTRKPGKLRI